ncbi:MAG: tetratricopeptide repeat protein [Candidatus Dormibacteraeota bacterium]|nr:tetratricopeptide repeat protein [Candidatus Dormibacteraeota bacterium]
MEALAQIEVAEQASAGLDGVDAHVWRARIDDAYAHLEAAADWLLANHRADDAERLAVALERYWVSAGRIDEGRVMFARVVGTGGLSDPSRARALFSLGMLAFWQGDDTAARAAFDESVQLARQLTATNLEALALTGLARISLRNGDFAEARSLCQSALDVAASATETRGRSSAIHVLSVAAQMTGDLERARDLMQQRLELEREAGSLRLVAAECTNLSAVERQLGNIADARDLLQQALDIQTQQEDVWSIPYSFNQLAAIEAQSGDMARAAALLGLAERMVEEQGAGWPPDEAPVFERTRRMSADALGEDGFARAWTAGAAMSWQEVAAPAHPG